MTLLTYLLLCLLAFEWLVLLVRNLTAARRAQVSFNVAADRALGRRLVCEKALLTRI